MFTNKTFLKLWAGFSLAAFLGLVVGVLSFNGARQHPAATAANTAKAIHGK